MTSTCVAEIAAADRQLARLGQVLLRALVATQAIAHHAPPLQGGQPRRLIGGLELAERLGIEQVGFEVVVPFTRRLGQPQVGAPGFAPLTDLVGVPGQSGGAGKFGQCRHPIERQRRAMDTFCEVVADGPGHGVAQDPVAKAEGTAPLLHQQAGLLEPEERDLGIHRENVDQIAVHLAQDAFHLVDRDLGREQRYQAGVGGQIGGQLLELAADQPLTERRLRDPIEHLRGHVPGAATPLAEEALPPQPVYQLAEQERHPLGAIGQSRNHRLGHVLGRPQELLAQPGGAVAIERADPLDLQVRSTFAPAGAVLGEDGTAKATDPEWQLQRGRLLESVEEGVVGPVDIVDQNEKGLPRRQTVNRAQAGPGQVRPKHARRGLHGGDRGVVRRDPAEGQGGAGIGLPANLAQPFDEELSSAVGRSHRRQIEGPT